MKLFTPVFVIVILMSLFVSTRPACAFDPQSALDKPRNVIYECPSNDPDTCDPVRVRYLKLVKRVMCQAGWATSLAGIAKRIEDLTSRIAKLRDRLKALSCDAPRPTHLLACIRVKLSISLLQRRLSRVLATLDNIKSDFIRECKESAKKEVAKACPFNKPGDPPAETQKYCEPLLKVLEDPKASAQEVINAITKAVADRCADVTAELAACPEDTPTPTPTPTDTEPGPAPDPTSVGQT